MDAVLARKMSELRRAGYWIGFKKNDARGKNTIVNHLYDLRNIIKASDWNKFGSVAVDWDHQGKKLKDLLNRNSRVRNGSSTGVGGLKENSEPGTPENQASGPVAPENTAKLKTRAEADAALLLLNSDKSKLLKLHMNSQENELKRLLGRTPKNVRELYDLRLAALAEINTKINEIHDSSPPKL